MNLEELYYNVNRYYNLLKGIKEAVATLSSPSSKLDEVKQDLIANFSYDDIGVCQSRVGSEKKSIDDIISTINNTIIPAINDKIYSLNVQIENYSEEESV